MELNAETRTFIKCFPDIEINIPFTLKIIEVDGICNIIFYKDLNSLGEVLSMNILDKLTLTIQHGSLFSFEAKEKCSFKCLITQTGKETVY